MEEKKCPNEIRTQDLLRGALGFSVLRFWLFFRSVFRFLLQKTSVFRFWWSLRFADFSFFSIWFSVFVKNTSGFSVLVPDVVFGFSYFVLFWVPVSVRFEQHFISNSRETPKLFRGMRDKINVMVGDQASPLTPGETLTSQTRATIWSVCELWLPTCLPHRNETEEAIVDCVAFFYDCCFEYLFITTLNLRASSCCHVNNV